MKGSSSQQSSRPFTIVVPCYNEEQQIARTIQSLLRVTESYENVHIVIIDDGSVDQTQGIITELADRNAEVDYLSFTRNFGKEAAMYAGLEIAVENESAVIFVDADGEHPTDLILQMLEASSNGFDHIVAERERRLESGFLRKILASGSYRFLSHATGLPITNGHGDFRLLSAGLAANLKEFSERSRFSKGLYTFLGEPDLVLSFEVPEIVDLRKSRWNYRQLLSYTIDALTGFNVMPLRKILTFGILTLIASVIYGITLVSLALTGSNAPPGYITTSVTIVFFGSVNLVALGIIGEYIGRVLLESKQRPLYLVRKSSIDV